MTSEGEEDEDVDSGWDLGALPRAALEGPASARPTPVPSSSPSSAEDDPVIAVSPPPRVQTSVVARPGAGLGAARVGAATRPNASPVPPAARPTEKREVARTSPALRTSIGLRKPAGQTESPGPSDAEVATTSVPPDRVDRSEEAPPTVGRPMPPPRSRSNTPKVTNAVQKARALDEALATTPAGGAPAAKLRFPAPEPTGPKGDGVAARPPGGGIRIPLTDRSTTPAVTPTPDPTKPPPTALRFSSKEDDRPAASPVAPRGRKETLKLNQATQDFAVKMLTRDADRAERRHPSAPPLDLHLPLELSLDEPLESVHLVRRGDPGFAADDASSRGPDDPGLSLDDDIHVSIGEEHELAPDELAAVDQLDDVLDGLIDSLPTASLQSGLQVRAKSGADRLPRTAPPPPGSSQAPPSLRELDLSLELDDPESDRARTGAGPRSKEQPASLNPASHDPATTRGFHEDDPVLAPIRDRVAKGDFMGALMRAEKILQTEPDHIGATYFATMCQEKIRDLYFTRLGSSEGIPHIQLAPDAIVALALDNRSGFLISLIDGIASIDDVLDMSGMPPIEALRLLLELKNEGVIGID